MGTQMDLKRQAGSLSAPASCPLRAPRTPQAPGVTLIEMMLVLVLLGLMVTVSAVLLQPQRDAARFEEGVYRFETLLRMARTEAGVRGTRLRLSVQETEQGPQPILLREADPLQSPGTFTRWTDCPWSDTLPADGLVVLRMDLRGEDAHRRAVLAALAGEADDPAALAAITFEPDGSCDSGRIVLAPPDPTDPRRALVELDGVNGTVRVRSLLASELEEQYPALVSEEGR